MSAEDTVLDLMGKLEQSVEAAKAARRSAAGQPADDQPVPDVIPEPPEDAAQIPPDGLNRATWLLRGMRDLDAAHAQNEEVFHAELERLTTWIEGRRRVHTNDRKWYELELEGLHRAMLRDDPERKTLNTPYGKSTLTTYQPKVDIEDVETAAKWAAKHYPEALKLSVRITDLRNRVKVKGGKPVDTTGEVVPGLKVTEEETKWNASVADGEPF